MKFYVGVIAHHTCEGGCVGIWNSLEQAKTDIEVAYATDPEFSDRDYVKNGEPAPYWGTEEWTITLSRQEVSDPESCDLLVHSGRRCGSCKWCERNA